jgi:hypothetical protein
VGMVLVEQDDEWQDGRRYFRAESMALIDATAELEEVAPALLMAKGSCSTQASPSCSRCWS